MRACASNMVANNRLCTNWIRMTADPEAIRSALANARRAIAPDATFAVIHQSSNCQRARPTPCRRRGITFKASARLQPRVSSSGGAEEDRTPDLLRARQLLSQLSYGPRLRAQPTTILVGLGGFEPPTSPLSGAHSNQLSYRPRA